MGAADSTGRGEANLYNLCSFLIVEEMRLRPECEERYAGVSMYASTFAVCTEKGAQTLNTEPLFEGRPDA